MFLKYATPKRNWALVCVCVHVGKWIFPKLWSHVWEISLDILLSQAWSFRPDSTLRHAAIWEMWIYTYVAAPIKLVKEWNVRFIQESWKRETEIWVTYSGSGKYWIFSCFNNYLADRGTRPLSGLILMELLTDSRDRGLRTVLRIRRIWPILCMTRWYGEPHNAWGRLRRWRR